MQRILTTRMNEAFEGISAITLAEAKKKIEEILQRPIEEEKIKAYLRAKQIDILQESEVEMKEERDLTIDEILQLRDQRQKGEGFRDNVAMIRDYQEKWDHSLFQELLVQNRRLVYSMANRYQGYLGHQLELDDLVSEGMFGLARAILRFDPTRRNQFSTYAYWWIRHMILRAIIQTGFTVRVPNHLVERIIKIVKLEQQQLLDDQELDWQAICMELQITKEQYWEAKQVEESCLRTASLNTIVSEKDSDTELAHFISDVHVKIFGYHGGIYRDPEVIFGEKCDKKALREIMERLKPREREVLILRYGLEDGRFRTLEEVGNRFGVTRERIRQIEKKAFTKLRRWLRKEEFLVS